MNRHKALRVAVMCLSVPVTLLAIPSSLIARSERRLGSDQGQTKFERSASVRDSRTPTISDVKIVTPITGTAIVSWRTDQLSDSLVFFGTNYYGQDGGATDTVTGTKEHSQTITGLWPGQSYMFGIRSRGFSKGAPDPKKARFETANCEPSCSLMMPAPPKAGILDFRLAAMGPNHVVQGFPIYVSIAATITSGSAAYKNDSYKVSVLDLPPNSEVHWPDQENNGLQQGLRSKTTAVNDTLTQWDIRTTQFELTTNIGGKTPVGNYTITIRATTKLGNGTPGPTKTLEWPLSVIEPSTLTIRAPANYPPIPHLSTWESNMIEYGAGNYCRQLGRTGEPCDAPYDQCVTFYDAERVYFQIADYDRTHRLSKHPEQWLTCAQNSERSYRDGYVLAQHTPGAVKGYWVFPHGLYMDFQRNEDVLSKAAVHDLATKGYSVWASIGNPPDVRNMREISYKLDALLLDEELGNDHLKLIEQLVSTLLGDIDQIVNEKAEWHQPFMDGLLAETLIQYYESGHQNDLRIPPAIKLLADYLWEKAWIPNKGAGYFFYNSYQYSIGIPSSPTLRNLNLLIAPMYAWIFKTTGDPTYQQRGDQIWSSGVLSPPADGIAWTGKNFSQNYRWSFDYVKWRSNPHTD